jgi:hypothetical protein
MIHINDSYKVRYTIHEGQSCFEVLENKALISRIYIIEDNPHRNQQAARKKAISIAKYNALNDELKNIISDRMERQELINYLIDNKKVISRIINY